MISRQRLCPAIGIGLLLALAVACGERTFEGASSEQNTTPTSDDATLADENPPFNAPPTEQADAGSPAQTLDPQVVMDEYRNVVVATETRLGQAEITMRITNLQEADTVTPDFVVHSSDFQSPEYTVGDLVASKDNPGAFDRVVTLKFLYKYVFDVTRYEDQKQTFAVARPGVSPVILEKIISVLITKSDKNGEVADSKPSKTLRGSEGRPDAPPS